MYSLQLLISILCVLISVILSFLTLFYFIRNTKYSGQGLTEQKAFEQKQKQKRVIQTIIIQSVSPILLMTPGTGFVKDKSKFESVFPPISPPHMRIEQINPPAGLLVQIR